MTANNAPFWELLLRPVLRVLKLGEAVLYAVRNALWGYPDALFFGERSLTHFLFRSYLLLRPYSHIVASVAAIGVFVVALGAATKSSVLALGTTRYVEAVVTGLTESGALQQLSKVNPIVTSNIQLEKDLSELIYEPMIRYQEDGQVQPVLAQSIVRIAEGSSYAFNLRDRVYWHDGVKFSIEDVLATLELVDNLDPNRYDNTYVKAIQQMAWERFGDNSIQICTITTADRASWQKGELLRPCSGTSGAKPILSNFLELISIKIMPAHLIGELNSLNMDAPGPRINQFPIGTGPFKFVNSAADSIVLARNKHYYAGQPDIDEVEFRLFGTEEEALRAVKYGQAHALATVSTINLQEIKQYPKIDIKTSPASHSQYWSIYFNLRKSPTGETLAPEFFQDVNVRKAIALGVDRGRVIEALSNVGQIARGPIADDSRFFNPSVDWGVYNPSEAKNLLEKAGWQEGSDGIRVKNGQRLSFKLTYASTYDREQTAQTILQNLKGIGVEVVPQTTNTKQLIDEVVLGKQFEALLYGMHTFIDPDRYELFHSSQANGLNLAGYVGSEKAARIENKKTIRLPKVDQLLELGRRYDPLAAKDRRRDTYFQVQQLIANDIPEIFLYRPQFLYYINQRVTGVDIARMNSLEDRFLSISAWRIE